MGVADDKGDRHGLTQGPAQPQEPRPDDPHQAVRDGHLAGHLPGGGPHAEGRFLHDRRHQLKHVPGDGADEGQHHEGQDDPGGEHADAHGRALKQRQKAQRLSQDRLDVVGHKGGEDKQPPHAVDDAGDGGQQLDERCPRSG